jgi:hypothetical protein
MGEACELNQEAHGRSSGSGYLSGPCKEGLGNPLNGVNVPVLLVEFAV